jgi:hypothetical protein
MSRYSIDFFSKFEKSSVNRRIIARMVISSAENHLAYLKANRERQIALGVNNVEWVSLQAL